MKKLLILFILGLVSVRTVHASEDNYGGRDWRFPKVFHVSKQVRVNNRVEVDSKGQYRAFSTAAVCYKKKTELRCNSCPCYGFDLFYESHIF
jgi:hypothetical protein